jgi:hypothetical protein
LPKNYQYQDQLFQQEKPINAGLKDSDCQNILLEWLMNESGQY